MESPFAKQNSSNHFVLYLEPFLNSYYKSYQNIITLSNMPSGILANMVSVVSSPKLSEFQSYNSFHNHPHHCIYALMRYPTNNGSNITTGHMKCSDAFMTADDIPSVLSFLIENGYSIQTDLTKLIYKSGIFNNSASISNFSGNKKIIAIVSK